MKKSRINNFYDHRLVETKQKRLYVSNMFDIVYNFFNEKAHNKTPTKFILFSGHDTTIVNVLVNILAKSYLEHKAYEAMEKSDNYYFLVPPLASSVLFEIVEVEGEDQLFARVVYNGKEIKEGFIKNVKYYEDLDLLDFNDFRNLIFSRIEKDYKNLTGCINVQR